MFQRHLEPLLGAFSARSAMQTAAKRSLNKSLEELQEPEVLLLVDGLRPILNTLVGQIHAKIILNAIRIGLEK